ncbi:alpha/beta fold hydrolase [Acinetobacter courvalinii]|uniref:alpha/beta fold hydrolase n=1 Tax=Acinetobacter courvalinii TaxID=280147 RepID=UPI001901D084|nr:alpha/beta hydrolase [Acinetobacter courvalinii]MBJ8417814.1 alpha/beta hydrolase [Acinetobacter courvalinii]
MKSDQLILQRDGLGLQANLYGDPDHPLVVLLHGFPDTPHCWDKLYPILVDAGYQVLVPWLRGYTLDSVSSNAHYGLASATADLKAWLEMLDVQKSHLVGHDWGAAIAMCYARQYKASLYSMSLLAVPPIPAMKNILINLKYFPKQLYLSSYMLLMQSHFAKTLLSQNQAEFVAKIWKKWSPTWQFTQADFAATREAFSQPQIAWAATRYYRSLFAVHHSINLKANRDLLRPIPLPTLALAGLDDGCMSIPLHRALAQSRHFSQGLRSIYLPNCGHFLQAEQPQRVAELLLEHFQQTTV